MDTANHSWWQGPVFENQRTDNWEECAMLRRFLQSSFIASCFLNGASALACGGDYWLNPARSQINADTTPTLQTSATIGMARPNRIDSLLPKQDIPGMLNSTSFCGVDIYFIVPDHGIYRADSYSGVQFFMTLFDPWWKEEERKRREREREIVRGEFCVEKWKACTDRANNTAAMKSANCGPATVNYSGTATAGGAGVTIGGSVGSTEGRAGDCLIANEGYRVWMRENCSEDWLVKCPNGQ